MKKEVHFMVADKISGSQFIRNKEGLEHLIASHYKFENFVINKYCTHFEYNGNRYDVETKNISENLEKEVVFTVILTFDNDDIIQNEKVINILIAIFSDYFSNIYITRDDISAELCKKSYQYIYDAENTLREFIMKFMISKIGNEWWTYNVTDSNINKANQRKQDFFNSKLNEDIYNIDFKDLAEIIFKNPSKFKTKTDVLNELNKCSTIEQFQELKSSALSNWDRYFSEYFDENWNDKWKELAEYRNRIAHNKLISKEVSENIRQLSNYVVNNIKSAITKIDEFKYSEQEMFTIENETIKVKSLKQKSDIIKLKECGIEPDDINQTIKDFQDEGKIKFSSADIVRKFNKGNYNINNAINKSMGYILSSMKEEFKIKQTGKTITEEDDRGNKTTCKEYTFVGEDVE